MARLRLFFEIAELPLSMSDVWQQVDDLLTGMKPGETNQVGLVFNRLV